MTTARRAVLVCGFLVLAGMCLYPPYVGVAQGEVRSPKVFVGWHPLWEQPSPGLVYERLNGAPYSAPAYGIARPPTSQAFGAYVDAYRLWVQAAVVAALTGAALAAAGRGRNYPAPPSDTSP